MNREIGLEHLSHNGNFSLSRDGSTIASYQEDNVVSVWNFVHEENDWIKQEEKSNQSLWLQ